MGTITSITLWTCLLKICSYWWSDFGYVTNNRFQKESAMWMPSIPLEKSSVRRVKCDWNSGWRNEVRVCVCVRVCVTREGWELSSAEWSYAKLPWKKWSLHKLFLNRVEVLVRGRDSQLLAQEAALGLHGLSGIMCAFMAASEASRWGLGSAALAFR